MGLKLLQLLGLVTAVQLSHLCRALPNHPFSDFACARTNWLGLVGFDFGHEMFKVLFCTGRPTTFPSSWLKIFLVLYLESEGQRASFGSGDRRAIAISQLAEGLRSSDTVTRARHCPSIFAESGPNSKLCRRSGSTISPRRLKLKKHSYRRCPRCRKRRRFNERQLDQFARERLLRSFSC